MVSNISGLLSNQLFRAERRVPSGLEPNRLAGFPQPRIRLRTDAEPDPGMKAPGMKRIVIAYDGSDGGREALVTGVELARGAGAVATLVYVRRAPAPLVGDPFYERALSKELRRGRDLLDEARAYAAESGVAAETELLEGDEAEGILELARLRGAELIVVGCRDRGAIVEALLGSVSRAIVDGADRPVLVAKRRARRKLRAA
jgi:nucleotide-binding universal stress UspA family protein